MNDKLSSTWEDMSRYSIVLYPRNLRTQQLFLGKYSNQGPSKVITVVLNTGQ